MKLCACAMDIKEPFLSKKIILQFIKFGIIGFSNTVIAFGIYYTLYFWGVHYMISNFFGWAIGVFNGFYWNKKYVFCAEGSWWSMLLKTYISYGITFLTGAALLFLMVEYFLVSPVLAPVFCLIITVFG